MAASLGGEQPSVCVKNVSGTLPPAAASRSIAFRRRRKGRRRAAGVRTEPDVGAQAILDEVSTSRVEARDRERHNPLRAQDRPRQPAIAHLARLGRSAAAYRHDDLAIDLSAGVGRQAVDLERVGVVVGGGERHGQRLRPRDERRTLVKRHIALGLKRKGQCFSGLGQAGRGAEGADVEDALLEE